MLGRPKRKRVLSTGTVIGGQKRSPDRAVYDSREWRVLRKAVLARDRHSCQICGAPANTVDHIVSWREAPELVYAEHNLRALCRRHNSREANKRRAQLARMMRAQLRGEAQPIDRTPGTQRQW